MQNLDLEISKELLGKLEALAELLHGDSCQESVDRTIGEALSLRLHWMEVSGEPAKHVEEPVIHIEGDDSSSVPREDISNWIFRGSKQEMHMDQIMEDQRIDDLVQSAAEAAGYQDGFGVTGCDLSRSDLWAAYARQSTEEQRSNNRLGEYLMTCAREAKALGVVVPREYIFYDTVTGEHLARPRLTYIRRQLVPDHKIAGIIFPALDRLSREPMHVMIFEFELTHAGVRYHYADVPSGDDPIHQMMRQNLAFAAKLLKLANRKNNSAGNVGRVLKGLVPAHRAPWGYNYRAIMEIGDDARVHIKNAWWEVNELGPDGIPIEESPAWVITKLFHWIGNEDKSLYWVATKLTEMKITAPLGGGWIPARVSTLLRNHCYTGSHAYNVNERIPNPATPITDVTAEIKRTMLRQKPESSWVRYEVPKIVDEELWQRANSKITAKGRGRGKQGKTIQALLRNRIFCPRCAAPMVVRRNGRMNNVYYHCSKYYKKWVEKPCTYSRLIPGTWDEIVWTDVCTLLRDDKWIDQELKGRQSSGDGKEKVIKLEQFKITQAKARIAKIQEGFEGGLYDLDEAKRRTSSHHRTVSNAEEESKKVSSIGDIYLPSQNEVDALKQELQVLRDKNLDEATFEERLDLIAKLGIQVHPREDLATMKVKCRVGFSNVDEGLPDPDASGDGPLRSVECGKVPYAPPLFLPIYHI